ncbi:hypothetical protein H5T87_10030, partial [bacterium]|nr:hypothetical protein [bacterium]
MLTDKDLDDREVTFMDITRALSQDRAIKAVTGMSIAEFKSLAEKFERVYEMKRIKVYEEEVMSG